MAQEGDWAILIKMPREVAGRAETEYALFNIPMKKEIDLSKTGHNVGDMCGFDKYGDKIFLVALDNKTSKEIKIELNSLENK
ncbi:MAG: hypothetical protein J7M11_04095 [Elusimicrobia bacterium]|nr:hypothetical protein [Elusimicrobiota bacterium]